MNEDVRIIHGDCLEVMPRLEANSIDLILADPPYGIDYQSAWRTDRSKWKPKIANDTKPFVEWLPEAYRIAKNGSAMACFCTWKVQEEFREAIKAAKFEIKSQVIWDRDWNGMGDLGGEFAPQHDVIWFATKGRFVFPGARPKSVLRYQRVPADRMVHPNEKPIPLLVSLVKSLCPRGGAVFDPFSGSGVVAFACSETGRRCIATEMEEGYVDVSRARLAGARKPLFDGPQSPLFDMEGAAS